MISSVRLYASLLCVNFLQNYFASFSVSGGFFTEGPDSLSLLDGTEWKSSVDLAENGAFKLSWKTFEHRVVFLVEAKTSGYVAIGFSPDGTMAKADILVGWINDKSGKPYILDCYGGVENGMPLKDFAQNVELLGGYQNISHTTLMFGRSWDTCDKNHDVILGNDTIKFIWAMDDLDPQDETLYNIRWHGKQHRGSRNIHLRNPPIRMPLKYQFKHWDVTISDFTIMDNMRVFCWCKVFKVPRLLTKHHVIGYTPLLDKRNSNVVQSMILYECNGKHTFHMEQYVAQNGFKCHASNIPLELETCIAPVATWAMGAEGEFLPDHVGIPVGGENMYYMLEVHYNNPRSQRVTDSSGIRLHYSEKLRKHDGGIFVTGTVVSPLHIIPPYQAAYKTAGYCDKYCTNSVFPAGGVNSVSVSLHSHTAARKVKVRLFRQGEELHPIMKDDQYDFQYQQSYSLQREVTVFPGDELVTECTFNTINRTHPTQGGYSMKQEMCLAYITYYPRVMLSRCQSTSPASYFFHTFGIKRFYNLDMDTVERMFLKLPEKQIKKQNTKLIIPLKFHSQLLNNDKNADENEASNLALKQLVPDFTADYTDEKNPFQDLVILDPSEFKDKTFSQHLQDLPWKETLLTQRVEETFYYGKHTTFCRLKNDSLALPASIHIFPKVMTYQVPNSDNCQSVNSKVRHQLDRSDSIKSENSTVLPIFLMIFLISVF